MELEELYGKFYKEILAYAGKHKLELSGFSYEKGINETVVDRIEDYIVEIEIPITPQSSFTATL